jgi:hypothetical protein
MRSCSLLLKRSFLPVKRVCNGTDCGRFMEQLLPSVLRLATPGYLPCIYFLNRRHPGARWQGILCVEMVSSDGDSPIPLTKAIIDGVPSVIHLAGRSNVLSKRRPEIPSQTKSHWRFNFSAVDGGSPIPDNVSRRRPMKDKSMLWMAALGVALFLFFACPPVRRRTVRAARACWSQIRAKLPRGATHPARRPASSYPVPSVWQRSV